MFSPEIRRTRSVGEATLQAGMSHLKILEPDAASPAVRAVYSDFLVRMSFPAAPNFIKVQGHSPTVVQGSWWFATCW